MKVIAVHLPQFHPIPENDLWWGKGFTEWRNVVKARPRFTGHYQPHLPADLGFYDLRLEESRVAQAQLAKEHNISGFCFYHYWFNGKRLLNQPLDDMLRSGNPDFPFMLCWANENWTRRWDGQDSEILMAQHYGLDDAENHSRFLCQTFFRDRRYIRVDGKPFFVIYRPEIIPDISRVIERFRKVAHTEGIGDLHIGFTYGGNLGKWLELGFDCAIQFQPQFDLPMPRLRYSSLHRYLMKLGLNTPFTRNKIYDYRDYARKMMERPPLPDNIYPGIMPMWDNSARRKTNATIFVNSSPAVYGDWLSKIVSDIKSRQESRKIIFVNAWNEWAEGNHLEPCERFKSGYLEVTKRVLENA